MANYGGVINIFEEQDSISSSTELVSLGDHCVIALYLKKFHHRHCSYPFDWIVSNVDIIKHILDDNFNIFITQPSYYDDYLTSGKIFNHHTMYSDKSYFVRCIARFHNLKNKVVFFLAVSNTGGDSKTNLKTNHRSYTIDDFDDIIYILHNKYNIVGSILVVLNLLETQPKAAPTHTKVHEHLEIYNLYVKLWGANLDNESAKKLKTIFQHYSEL